MSTHQVTIAVPQALMADANSFMLVCGASPYDNQTFDNAGWQDASSNLYAVAAFSASDAWILIPTNGLPSEVPGYVTEADKLAAQRALDAINNGVILFGLDPNPHDQLAAWGLARVPVDDI